MNRPTRRRWGWPAVFLVILVGAVAWAGWQYHERRYPSWYEEVRLSDGRVITIHQKHDYIDGYGTHQSWVTIDLPELGGRRVWHSFLMPQRIDVYEGQVYVFGLPRGPKQLDYYRYPKYYMVAFRWSGAEFDRIAFLDVPEKLRAIENVRRCVQKPLPKIVTLDLKQKTHCPPGGDKGELTEQLDTRLYSQAVDRLAALSNWTNRSE